MFNMDDVFSTLQRPKIEPKPWMKTKVMALVTEANLPKAIDECIAGGRYAIDLECTGLDNRVFDGRTTDHIVGICLSPDGQKGYYIPILHQDTTCCLPRSLVFPEIKRLVDSEAVAIFHNGKFDQEFLEFNGDIPLGDWLDPMKWDDTLLLAFLRNSRERNKGLKHLSKTLLDMEMIELDELFSDEERRQHGLNFSVLDPSWEPAIWYACSDAICTWLLYKKLKPEALDPTADLPSQQGVYYIEKLCVAGTRWMERCRIPINKAKVEELIRVGQREWLPSLLEVYTAISETLGRDITPSYVKILNRDPHLGLEEQVLRLYAFDPEIVDASTGIGGRIDNARKAADQRRLDPLEPNGKGGYHISRIQKVVPKIARDGDREKPSGSEAVLFPVVYDLTIPEQLGLCLRELGVAGLKATAKSGQVKTSKDEIDRVIEGAGEELKYLKKIKRFREIAKALGSNLQVILNDLEKSPDSRIKVVFGAWGVDTGRFSTPQSKGADKGQSYWNLHSIPKATDDLKKRPECMGRIREVVAAEDGEWIIVAVDYSGQELRVVTNLSGEPLWIDEFFRCADCGMKFPRGGKTPPPPEPPPAFCPNCGSDKIGDLHSLTAIAIYGDNVRTASDFKDKRGKAKALNFAIVYGGGGSAAQRAVGVSKEEGWRIKHKFDATYKGITTWQKRQHNFGKKTGFVLTAFNRRYPVPDINSADGFFRSKAERNATNGPVQGTGADLTKYAMGIIYRELKKRGWLDRVRMIITIHDELVFEIMKKHMVEVIDLIVECMTKLTVHKRPWQVPLTVDVEAGHDWSVPWNITHMKFGKTPRPPELAGIYAAVGLNAKPSPTTIASDSPPVVRDESEALPPTITPQMSPEATQAPLKAGEPCIHKIKRRDLTLTTISSLARVIARCAGRGSHPLQIVVEETGEAIWAGDPVYVNPGEFALYLRDPDIRRSIGA